MNSTTSRKPVGDIVVALLAFLAGSIAAWADMHNDEPQPAAALLILFGMILGFARPHRAWLWAVIAGLSLPIWYLAAPIVGITPRTAPEPISFASALAVVPALIGAAVGVALSKGRLWQRDRGSA